MPEGDTIHRAAAALRRALEGKTITHCEIRRAQRGVTPPQPGARVDRVQAVGKHLIMRFDDGRELHTHLGMAGAWHVYGAHERWKKPQHLARVILTTEDGVRAVCFSAPLVEIRDPATARRRGLAPSRAERQLDALGPDLTVEGVDIDAVVARLATVDHDTEIAVVLLDQRVAAGIGNVIKSETCWVERVNPFTTVGALDEGTRRRLYTRAHSLLAASVAQARRVTVDGGLAVYGRAGRPCPRCRSRIVSATQGDDARRTYWCTRCQPTPTSPVIKTGDQDR